MDRRRNLGALVLAGLLVVLAACGGGASAAGNGESGGTLTWGWALPSTWDPATSAIGNDTHALALTYAALTQLDVKGNTAPAVAKSWKYNSAGTQVTFTLRPGLKFSDGTALDAAAVKFNIERGRDAKNSTIGDQLAGVKDVTVANPTTVTLVLTKPDYQIPALLAGKTGDLVSPTAAKKNAAGLSTKPVGAGPFILTDYVPDSHANLKRNPNYWDAKDIKLDNFVLKPAPDPSVAVAGLQSGQYNVATIPPSQIQSAKAAGLKVKAITTLNVRTLDVNGTVAPFNNPKVMQAISHAINRKELVKTAFFGQGIPDWQPFPNNYVGYDPSLDNLYAYDPTEAKKLLAEAGHPNGLDIDLWVDDASDAIAEVLQKQFGESGIRVKLKVEQPGINNYLTRQYPLALDSFSGRESPVQALSVLFGQQGLMNIGRTNSTPFEQALAKARATPLDSPDYPKAIQAATAAGVKTMPNTFLFSWARIFAYKSDVKGLKPWVDTQRFEGVTVQ
ncbi:MAG TPA: ABC transporter substrate-binding protein [Mycobacteriales bacterium]|nr:ABC transporter substrate-binding protein [Mycobacteriales bacterium]